MGEREITPPVGTPLTGYANRARGADQILDPLYARAFALQAPGHDALVLVSSDLLAMSHEMIEHIRAAVAGDIPSERLLVNHSHTHAGPATVSLVAMGQPDRAYCEFVVERTVAAILDALSQLVPVSLWFAVGQAAIGVNRRRRRWGKVVLSENPRGPYDPAVSIVLAEGVSGRPLSCWFSHATHPTVLGRANTGISADWPGAACAALAHALQCPSLFAQGCSGDIAPRRRGSHAAAGQLGWQVAETVLAALQERTELAVGPSLGALERLRLAERRASFEAAEREGVGVGLESPPVEMDVQVLRLGDLAVVALASEPFAEIGMGVRGISPFEHTVVLGYSNGCVGYLPTARALRGREGKRGYEIEEAPLFYGTRPFAPECEQLTLDAVARLFRQVL